MAVPSELVDAGTVTHPEKERRAGCEVEFRMGLHGGHSIVRHDELRGNATAQDSRDTVASHEADQVPHLFIGHINEAPLDEP